MITLITRFNVLAALLILVLFGSNILAAQENTNDTSQQLTELEELYAEVEIKLKEQSQELDRLLSLGYGGVSLRKDMTDIAENTQALEARLNDLGEQLDVLIKSINVNPLKPFEIIVHRGAKDAPALTVPVSAGEILYFTADIAPRTGKDIETRLNWSIVTPEGKPSEKLKKTEDIILGETAGTYSFGINTRGLEDGQYKVILGHHVTDNPKHKYTATATFDLGMLTEIKIIRLVVDDERSGDQHQPVLPEGAFPYLFTYYKVPTDVAALSARYRVRDLTNAEDIYQKTGQRNSKPDQDIQRVGIRLDPDKIPLTLGHEYRFDISLTDDLRPAASVKKYSRVNDSISFFYGNEPRYVKIDRFVVGTSEGARDFVKNIPRLTTPLYLNGWVRAAKSIDSIEAHVRLINLKDKSVIFETTVTRKNDKEKGLNRLSFPVKAELLTEGAKYRQEATIRVDGLDPVTARRSFTYARKPPADMAKYVKVAGVIRTPGLPDVAIKLKGTNKYRQNSTLIFTVPPVYPEGVNGTLLWKCKICGKGQPRILLDGSNNDWGFSFSPGKKRWGRKIELFHKGGKLSAVKLYSASFSREEPFQASLLSGIANARERNFYPWGLDNVGIKLRANSFATNATVTVKATSQESGKTVYSKTKSMGLPAGKDVKWLWNIDPDIFKFDLESKFPGLSQSDTQKSLRIKVTIEDGSGYKTARSTTLTREIFVINDKKYFKKYQSTPENPLVRTILPPAGMRGPFKTTIMGLSPYYTEGLQWFYDPDKLESWIVEANAKKYKEDEDRKYYRKTVPLLLSIEDSTGKQAVAFWKNFTYSVSIWKESGPDGE